MKISPVSFGKTVKVIGNKQIVQDIVRLANEKTSKPSERVLQRGVKNIFNDIDHTTGNNKTAAVWCKAKDGYYILSGKEAEKVGKMPKEKLIAKTKEPYSIFVGYNSRGKRHIEKFQ